MPHVMITTGRESEGVRCRCGTSAGGTADSVSFSIMFEVGTDILLARQIDRRCSSVAQTRACMYAHKADSLLQSAGRCCMFVGRVTTDRSYYD